MRSRRWHTRSSTRSGNTPASAGASLCISNLRTYWTSPKTSSAPRESAACSTGSSGGVMVCKHSACNSNVKRKLNHTHTHTHKRNGAHQSTFFHHARLRAKRMLLDSFFIGWSGFHSKPIGNFFLKNKSGSHFFPLKTWVLIATVKAKPAHKLMQKLLSTGKNYRHRQQ